VQAEEACETPTRINIAVASASHATLGRKKNEVRIRLHRGMAIAFASSGA
jgi:hypothetical protein